MAFPVHLFIRERSESATPIYIIYAELQLLTQQILWCLLTKCSYS